MLGRSDWLISEGVEFPKDIDEALTKSRRAGHGSSSSQYRARQSQSSNSTTMTPEMALPSYFSPSQTVGSP